jgi:hypothetical protein
MKSQSSKIELTNQKILFQILSRSHSRRIHQFASLFWLVLIQIIK